MQALESQTYRASYSDGIIDLLVGASLLWIGIAWIFLPDIAGLAGVFPAVLVTPFLAWRKKFLGDRAGYVRWSGARRGWERRGLLGMLAAGVGTFLLGLGVFIATTRGDGETDVARAIMPGLIAFLLSLMALGLGVLMQARRMFVYAAVLAAGGVVTAWADANPGWPLLPSGALVLVTGLVMLVQFVRDNPVVDAK